MGQTEAGNLMSAFYAEDAKAITKLEDKNFKKGPLGYVGGIKGAIQDTTAGVQLGQSMQELAAGAEDMFDPRSYTKAGQEEKAYEQFRDAAVEQREREDRLFKDHPELKTDLSSIYADAMNNPLQNYDITMKNLVTKLNSDVITNPSSGETTPIVVSSTPEQVNSEVTNRSNSVIVPSLQNGKVVKYLVSTWNRINKWDD